MGATLVERHTRYVIRSSDRTRSYPTRLITHRFKLDKIIHAYDTFARAAETNALKVIIEA